MYRARSLLLSSALALTLPLAAAGATTAQAQAVRSPAPTTVHVATIRGPAPGVDTLRRALAERIDQEREVRSVDRRDARFVVRGAIVDCERRRAGRQHEVRCEVAWVITDASSENVRAVIEARGTARGRNARALEGAALEAATRSVVDALTNPGQLARRQPS